MLCMHSLKMKIAGSSESEDLENKMQLLSVLDHSLNHTQLAEVWRTLCLYAFEFSSGSGLQEEFTGPLAGTCLPFTTADNTFVHTKYLIVSTFQNCGSPERVKQLHTGNHASELAEMTSINQAQQV